jgi:hypothetical protein
MYILRFKLLHFVNSLHNYVMTRVSNDIASYVVLSLF